MYLWIHLKIFFVCEEVLNHKKKGQVCTQSTLNSGDFILILHVLSFLECGLQIKKTYFSVFFLFFFCKSFVVSEKWPVQATVIAAWISHFPSNYVYLIREKESQYHLVVIIERNVVVIYVLHLYCLGEQMKSKEAATELIVWPSLRTF